MVLISILLITSSNPKYPAYLVFMPSPDAKFFDPKYIFKDVVSEDTKQKATILRDPSKVKKAKAEGYTEGDYTLYHPVPIKDFMSSEDPLELLNGCSEVRVKCHSWDLSVVVTKSLLFILRHSAR